mgnify:CR=1 FL=1
MSIEKREKARQRYLEKKFNKYGLNPRVYEAINTVIDLSQFDPDKIGPKNKAKVELFRDMAEKSGREFNATGINDFRDEKVFNKFLENVESMME